MLGQALLEMAGVGLIPAYLAVLVEPERVLSSAPAVGVLEVLGLGPEQLTQRVLLYVGSALIVAVFTLKLLYSPLVVYLRARFVQGLTESLGNRLLSDYVYAPYPFHITRSSAELIRNVTAESLQIGPGLIQPILGLIGQVLIVLCVAALLIASAPGVGLLTLVVSGLVSGLLAQSLGGRIRRRARVAQASRKRILAATQEVLNGVKELKLLGRQGGFLARFRRALRKVQAQQRFMQVVSQLQPLVLEWVVAVTLLVLIWVLFLSGKSIGVIVGTAALFALASVRLKASIGAIVNQLATIQAGSVNLDLVWKEFKLLEALSNNADACKPSAAPMPLSFNNAIELEDIWFRYPGAEGYALRGINLRIRRGEVVGLVGPSGGGKSTLVDIILGLFNPDKGVVRVDGEDIRPRLPAWHRSLGYIPQSIFLLDGTIRQNIALGLSDEEIDEAAVHRAAEAASLGEVVRALPQGLNSKVGERGVRLSGGQRQRIAIARALYHDPQVLVMDEATSALDNLTEKAVMEAVNALRGERTILLIAHRLSTVRTVDRIIYLRGGEIEATGTYDELIADHAGFGRMAGAH
jgi:ATP-binding cassette subfamily C protein